MPPSSEGHATSNDQQWYSHLVVTASSSRDASLLNHGKVVPKAYTQSDPTDNQADKIQILDQPNCAQWRCLCGVDSDHLRITHTYSSLHQPLAISLNQHVLCKQQAVLRPTSNACLLRGAETLKPAISSTMPDPPGLAWKPSHQLTQLFF